MIGSWYVCKVQHESPRVLSIWLTCSSCLVRTDPSLSLFSCLTRCWLWILPLLIHLNRWPLSPWKISTTTPKTTTTPTTNIVTVKWQHSIEPNIIKATIAKLARSAEEVSLTMNRICRIRWEPIWSSITFHKRWLKMKSKISSVQLVLLNLANLFAIKRQVKRRARNSRGLVHLIEGQTWSKNGWFLFQVKALVMVSWISSVRKMLRRQLRRWMVFDYKIKRLK